MSLHPCHNSLTIVHASPFVIFLASLRTLNAIRHVSIMSLCTMIYLAFIVAFFFGNAVHTHSLARDLTPWPTSIGMLGNVPVFVFSFTCHQNLPAIFNELPRAAGRRINTVVGASVLTCCLFYAFVGYLGLATYGHDIDSDLLSNFPGSYLIVTIARIGVCINVVLSVSLSVCRVCMCVMTVDSFLCHAHYRGQSLTCHAA